MALNTVHRINMALTIWQEMFNIFHEPVGHSNLDNNMNDLLLSYILVSIFQWQFNYCQGELHTEFRLSKAVNCDKAGLRWLMRNISLLYQDSKSYLNAHFDVIQDIKLFKKVHLHIERCNDQGYDCEDFQNWKIERFCQMMALKNQVWSEFVDHIHPSFQCPMKKASYEVRNATIDLEALMKWYPGMVKYRWKALCEITNEQDNIVYCGIFEIYLQQNETHGSRKLPKRPRNG